MSVLDRLRAWWSKDTVQHAEETGMTPIERDHAEEDYQARKDDVMLREHVGQAGVDFEADSEPLRNT